LHPECLSARSHSANDGNETTDLHKHGEDFE
jgi:hypothetical protein